MNEPSEHDGIGCLLAIWLYGLPAAVLLWWLLFGEG
jgi:hypothetical protein